MVLLLSIQSTYKSQTVALSQSVGRWTLQWTDTLQLSLLAWEEGKTIARMCFPAEVWEMNLSKALDAFN